MESNILHPGPETVRIIFLLLQCAVLLFMAILFLQSGLDKVSDRKGNVEWLTGHFANSPFAGRVPLLLSILTVTEILAGFLSLAGMVLLITGVPILAQVAMLVCLANFLMLFLGQRLAKDYAGAAGIVPYFLVGCLGVLVLLLG